MLKPSAGAYIDEIKSGDRKGAPWHSVASPLCASVDSWGTVKKLDRQNNARWDEGHDGEKKSTSLFWIFDDITLS